MHSLIWRRWAFAKKRQIKDHAKLTSYTVPYQDMIYRSFHGKTIKMIFVKNLPDQMIKKKRRNILKYAKNRKIEFRI